MGVIARRWSGSVKCADANDYEAYLFETGLKDYRRTPGNLGVQLIRRADAGLVQFEITSFWKDEESITRFAGGDIRKAVYYPEDSRYLVRKDDEVDHFDLVFLDLADGCST